MLLAILFFCLLLYFVRAAVFFTVQYIFGFGFSLAAPLDALLAAAAYAVYQQHLLEGILDCGFMLFRWVFCVFLCVWSLLVVFAMSWRQFGNSFAGCPTVYVREPFSLAACISLGVAAKTAAAHVDSVVPSRSATKSLNSLALEPPAFFAKPVPASSTGVLSMGIPRARRAASYPAAGSPRAPVSRRALPLSGSSSAVSATIDAWLPTTNAIHCCRRVGGVRRRSSAVFACSLAVRGKCRVGKPGRSAAGISLRRNFARALKAAEIPRFSTGISLWSSFRAAVANACQLLLVSSCTSVKANGDVSLVPGPAATTVSVKWNASSAARHVPRLPAKGCVKKPVVANATARKMRRAGLEDALRLHRSHLAATVSASRATATATETSFWSCLTTTAAAAPISTGSSRGTVPRLPASAHVRKPVAKSATQRRLRRAGLKEALCLHQRRLVAAGAVARAASAVREKEIAARPIRAISRRRSALVSAAGGTAAPSPTISSAVEVSLPSLPAAAVRLTSSVPDVVLATAASLAQRNRAAGASGALPAVGFASPGHFKKPISGSASRRRGVPPVSTTGWNPALSRGPWQPQNPASS